MTARSTDFDRKLVNGRNGSLISTDKQRILLPKSQAMIYEFQLSEAFATYGDGPRSERVHKCFEIFEELTEQSGAFKGIMQAIGDELKLSVYSQGFTSTNAADGRIVEKIPYFTIVNRVERAKYLSSDLGRMLIPSLPKLFKSFSRN